MIIERNPNNTFTVGFSGYGTVGFHATSSLATHQIEHVGFLPNKIFTPCDQQSILVATQSLTIGTADYEEWLQMRSVTFAQNESNALEHIQNGSSGGQGLGAMLKVLQAIALSGSASHVALVNNFISTIKNIRQSASVIYAVDLSNIGSRLVKDSNQPLYHIYFDPNSPLPKASLVSPLNIIARLEVI